MEFQLCNCLLLSSLIFDIKEKKMCLFDIESLLIKIFIFCKTVI